MEYSRVYLEVVTHWGEKRRSINRVVSPTLFFFKTLIKHAAKVWGVCAYRAENQRREEFISGDPHTSFVHTCH